MTKNMKIVDLHVHSNRSDGSMTPTELVYYAKEKGLSSFALTDHDCVEGIDEAFDAAKRLKEETGYDLEVIPGMEFSTDYLGSDVHIVALDIDYHSDTFVNNISRFLDSRSLRNEKMCEKLRERGIDISMEQLTDDFPDAVITRAHFGKYLYQKGYCLSVSDAFSQYIGDHAPCFVSREKVTPKQAVKLTRLCGGIPILAHPLLYGFSKEKLDTLTADLTESGLLGLECLYSSYTLADEHNMRKLAAKYDLAPSGGSDFHGTTKPGLDMATGYGKLFIPYEILEHLRQKLL
ncbi:MAG: PHP domain-containing protein [Lachnospiraceae bacterium]|nr:PHP domain-containing protein [Lachnospiraceae bacterium]